MSKAKGLSLALNVTHGGGLIYRGVSMTVSRFVLVDFRYTSDPLGHIRLYEAGNTYDMPPALAHAAAKRDFVRHSAPSIGSRRAS